METTILEGWTLKRLQGETTSAAFRDSTTGEWTTERAALHGTIINELMAGKRAKKKPKLSIVMGGVGAGKSTLITSKLVPEHSGGVVIDADQLWLKIPEYEALAREDWKSVADRTYAEVRYLLDAALAEAATRRLDIILEISGDEQSSEVMKILMRDGYEVSVDCVDCKVEVARERMLKRANTNPTPADNLWCSPENPNSPDKFDYKNVELKTFLPEYERRKANRADRRAISFVS